MKKFLAGLAFSALALPALVAPAMVAPAMAADLPAYKSPPSYAPLPYNWTGFYVGLNAGYADPTAKIGIVPGGSWIGDPDIPGVSVAATRNLRLSGFTGGAQLGYNYQVNNIVFGFEGDYNALNLKKSYSTPVFAGLFGGTYQASASVNLDYLATLRARLGFAQENWLFYLTGGVAFTGEKFRQAIVFNNVSNNEEVPRLPFTGPAGGANAGSTSKSAATWVLGAGVEYAFTRQISAKLEYLYVDLKNMQFGSVYGPNAFTVGTYSVQHRASLSGLNVFRVGVNYHF